MGLCAEDPAVTEGTPGVSGGVFLTVVLFVAALAASAWMSYVEQRDCAEQGGVLVRGGGSGLHVCVEPVH
jgi:hypothetical protein